MFRPPSLVPPWLPLNDWLLVNGLLGEHKLGRIKPGRIKRAALSLQNQNYHIVVFWYDPVYMPLCLAVCAAPILSISINALSFYHPRGAKLAMDCSILPETNAITNLDRNDQPKGTTGNLIAPSSWKRRARCSAWCRGTAPGYSSKGGAVGGGGEVDGGGII